MNGSAQIGLTGLAVMGQNLARNIARRGFPIAVHNRTTARTEEFLARHGEDGPLIGARSAEEFVDALARPRRILIMVKAGPAVDAVIDQLVPHLQPGDVLIDAGNSHFEHTRRRERALGQHRLHFMGVGISGGEEGALHGPSIMPGGSGEAYAAVEEVLTTVAAQVDGIPCCAYVGPDGAGHYVKMVHNGIEYADMQLIAEAYDLLRSGLGMSAPEIAEVFQGWNEGDLESFLVEITATVLRHVDAATGGPLVDVILDEAEQKGTGRWTAQSALELGVPITAITEAVFARILSSQKDARRVAARVLAGPEELAGGLSGLVDDLRQALYASKVVAYAQGFEQMAVASDAYEWDIDLASMATIWRGGCIIRARLLERIREAHMQNQGLHNLLLAGSFSAAIGQAQQAWRRVVATAVDLGVPVPGFSSALASYDGYRRERGPANLIQAQRDYFGAHTYRRTDREGTFHTRWSQDGREIEVDDA